MLKRIVHFICFFPAGKVLQWFAFRIPIVKTLVTFFSRFSVTNKLINYVFRRDAIGLAADIITINTIGNALCAGTNVLTTPHLKKYDSYTASQKIFPGNVTVVIPARNEEDSLPALIESLKIQRGVPHLKVLIIDDDSTDDTFARAITAIDNDPRFEIIAIPTPPPPGWIGKPAALEKARTYLEKKNTDVGVVVFVDADVIFHQEGLVRSLLSFEESSCDLLTIWPQHTVTNSLGNLFQPLIEWVWVGWAPRLLGNVIFPKMTIFTVTMGQILITKWDTYQAVGGHYAVRNNPLEDLCFGRSFRKKGYRTDVTFAKEFVTCEAYNSWSEFKQGYTKWLYRFFSKSVFIFFAPVLIILNIIGPSFGFSRRFRWHGIISYLSVAFSQICGAIGTGKVTDKYRWLSALLHPFTTVGTIYLIMLSHWMAYSSGVVWKGRVITKEGDSEDIVLVKHNHSKNSDILHQEVLSESHNLPESHDSDTGTDHVQRDNYSSLPS